MIWWVRAKRLVVVAVALFVATLISGLVWPLAIHHTVDEGEFGPLKVAADTGNAPFVGLALSGGGARAALFGAAGMKALDARGLLQDVTHVSSVSGGGFPASYLATHPEPDCQVAKDPSNCRNDYFDAMIKAIGRDFFWDLTKAQFRSPWRLMRPSARLKSLTEALDASYLSKVDFSQIKDKRSFYFNTVSYDTGQRFVFSNDAIPHPDAKDASLLPAGVRALSFSTPDVLGSTPDDISLALVVATSAAFPPYLGPMTIKVKRDGDKKPVYRHLGDGGILENSGVETLREAFLAREDPASALIYSFNAGQNLDKDLSRNSSDISIFSRDLPQFVDVLLGYASGQREAFFDQLMTRHGLKVDVVSFDYLNVEKIVYAQGADFPRWRSWKGWGRSCRPALRGKSSAPAKRLRKIPTDLLITKCDALLITEAAQFLVQHCLRANPDAACFVGRPKDVAGGR